MNIEIRNSALKPASKGSSRRPVPPPLKKCCCVCWKRKKSRIDGWRRIEKRSMPRSGVALSNSIGAKVSPKTAWTPIWQN